eukprot:scaffold1633_cov480-Prasinococcus_capsulatus_cf.AAC.1
MTPGGRPRYRHACMHAAAGGKEAAAAPRRRAQDLPWRRSQRRCLWLARGVIAAGGAAVVA